MFGRFNVTHVALAALAAFSPAVMAGTPINARTAAEPAGRVEIANTAGRVEVTGWNGAEVVATGELGKGSERLEFVRDGAVVRVKVVLPKSSRNVESTTLVVKVPAASTVVLSTVSADVTVGGVAGTQRLQTVSGNVSAATAGANVECRSVSGNVNVTGSGQRGLVSITTVSGNATANGVAGEVNASTVSGTVQLGVGELRRSRVRSTSGDVTLSAQPAADASLDVETISGDVRVDLAGTPGGTFELATMSGDIRNCFGPKPARTDEYGPGRELRFQQGSAAGRVRVKTLSGDIGLCTVKR